MTLQQELQAAVDSVVSGASVQNWKQVVSDFKENNVAVAQLETGKNIVIRRQLVAEVAG